MAKLTSIAPGPFSLNTTPSPPLTSSYGDRSIISREKSPDDVVWSSPEVGTKTGEILEKERLRNETERKLSGTSETMYIKQDCLEDMQPATSSSDESTRAKRSQSSASASSVSSKHKPQNLKLTPQKEDNNLDTASIEIEKPLPSPSYQAYRPSQPPQRLPRSPTYPDRPRTPAGYGPKRHNTQQFPVGPLSNSAQNGQQSIGSTNLKPGLPLQLYPGTVSRRPSIEHSSTQDTEPRPAQKLSVEPRSRSRSRSRVRGGERDSPDGQPMENEFASVGNPFQNLPLSASRNVSSSLSIGSKKSRGSRSRIGQPMIPPPSIPLPPIPLPPIHGPCERISTSGSIILGDISSLIKDLQDSITDFADLSLANEKIKPPTLPHLNRPTTPNAATEQVTRPTRQSSPIKKSAVKSNCRACGKAIQGKGLTSSDGRLTGRFHKACFVCRACREPFATSTFYVWDDLPYCSRHYHALNNSLCRSCDLGIEGPCLETESRERFHLHCFTCTVCIRSEYSSR